MRILLLGTHGQLGWELLRTLPTLGEIVALDYPDVDFTRLDSLRQTVEEARPQVIVNAAAYTLVDKAESEPAMARAINAQAPGVLAEAAQKMGAAFLHYSTDYVFDGAKGSAYTEEDLPNPVNAYGKTKLEGEQAVQAAGGAYFIFRTSWVYSLRRDSFVTKVLQWSRAQAQMRVVSDQVGSPTWARALAEISTQLLAMSKAGGKEWLQERRGLYHLAGEGSASRLEWAREVLKNDPHPEEQRVKELLPALTAEFPTPAQRPLYTALDCSRFAEAFELRLPAWERALELAMGAEA